MSDESNKQRVIVTDIHMPFLSMVVFMVKWAIAAIPALLILTVIGIVTWGILGGLILSLTRDRNTEAIRTQNIDVPSPVSISEKPTAPLAAELAYLDKMNVRDVFVEPMTLGRKGVVGELKNGGDRVVSDVEITIYCLDKNGRPIFEKLYHPVNTSDVSLTSSPLALKPGYSRRFEAIINDAPSEWSGKVEVKVTKIEFTEQP